MADLGFILDMDGTLVDSTGIIRRIQAKIMDKFNIVIEPERERELEEYAEGMFQENFSTLLAVKIMWNLMKEVGLRIHERLHAMILAGRWYLDELKNLKLYDGTEELFEFFEKNSIGYVIVTNSSDKSVARYLSNYQKFYSKMKPKIISKDSVVHIKPHPESFIMASEILKIPNERIVVVGDTKYDILFGKANNAITIGVLTGIYTKELLLKFKPDFIFDSIADIPNKIDIIRKNIEK